jgi:D-sedoheptulose 7-phosphate isomerase
MTNLAESIDCYVTRVTRVLEHLSRDDVAAVVQVLLDMRDRGGTVFLFGNGGSGATASHMYCDLAKGASLKLENRFRVICLNDNIPAMAAYANDISWEEVFVGPMKNLIKKDDVAIGISGSGNSMNVVKALEHANSVGATTIAWCGYDGGKIKKIADISVHVDINDMEVTEDVHLVLNHCIREALSDALKDEMLARSA